MVTVIPPWLIFCAVFNKRNKFTSIVRPFFAVVFFLFGIKVEVEGELPKRGKTCFILSNHQSFIDILAILYGISPSAFLAKKSLFKVFYFGVLLKYTGSIPVARGDHRANIELSSQIKNRLENNFPVCAFPEGTRSANGELLPFKNGIFRIIKDAGVPVLPVTILNAWKVFPKTHIALYPGTITIIPHEVINANEIENMNFEELRDKVRSAISSSIPKAE